MLVAELDASISLIRLRHRLKLAGVYSEDVRVCSCLFLCLSDCSLRPIHHTSACGHTRAAMWPVNKMLYTLGPFLHHTTISPLRASSTPTLSAGGRRVLRFDLPLAVWTKPPLLAHFFLVFCLLFFVSPLPSLHPPSP